MSVKATVSRQPVLAIGASVTGAVAAGVALVNAFWPGTVSDAQRDALAVFVVGMWPVLLWVRTLVTPAGDPRLPEGQAVKLPDGTSGTVVKK